MVFLMHKKRLIQTFYNILLVKLYIGFKQNIKISESQTYSLEIFNTNLLLREILALFLKYAIKKQANFISYNMIFTYFLFNCSCIATTISFFYYKCTMYFLIDTSYLLYPTSRVMYLNTQF